jgi:hypothetical protein
MPFDDDDEDPRNPFHVPSPDYRPTAGKPPRPLTVTTNWRPHSRNTLRGFVDIKLPSGLILHDCAYYNDGVPRCPSRTT